MDTANRPLIVGAGPVGIAAALFLARQNIPVRLIDRLTHRAVYSKALAVNPRTLAILAPTGVAEKILALGLRINGMNFWRHGKIIAALDFASLNDKHPYLVALAQSDTERLLEEALSAVGGRIERGVEMMHCRNVDAGAEVELKTLATDQSETIRAPWMLAADGAGSLARKQLQLNFKGTTFDHQWHLADVPMTCALAQDRAHLHFFDDGTFVFSLRVVSASIDTTKTAPIWRIMGNISEPAQKLAHIAQIEPPIWTSSFKISHRMAERMGLGSILLAGDAAHIHSPVGARGMNLGIEDAYVLSQLAASGKLSDYPRAREPFDYAVVRRVERISRLAAGESRRARFARRIVFSGLYHLPPVRNIMLKTLSGLDHPLLPAIEQTPTA